MFLLKGRYTKSKDHDSVSCKYEVYPELTIYNFETTHKDPAIVHVGVVIHVCDTVRCLWEEVNYVWVLYCFVYIYILVWDPIIKEDGIVLTSLTRYIFGDILSQGLNFQRQMS